jgi:hypothetical protein
MVLVFYPGLHGLLQATVGGRVDILEINLLRLEISDTNSQLDSVQFGLLDLLLVTPGSDIQPLLIGPTYLRTVGKYVAICCHFLSSYVI